KQGVLSKAKGAEYLQQTREMIAKSRAVKLMYSAPSSYKALSEQEDTEQGSTFLRYLKPEERARIAEQAETQIRERKDQVWRDEQRERERLHQNLQQSDSDFRSDAFARLQDPKANGPLTQQMIEAARQARTITPETYENFTKLARTEQIQGGVTD